MGHDIMDTSAVAGTGAAYTAISPGGDPPIDGDWYVFTPHVTNTISTPTISINGDTARAVGRWGHVGMPAKGMKGGRPYLIRAEGNAVFRVFEKLGVNFYNLGSVTGNGAAYTGTILDAETITNETLIRWTPPIANTTINPTLAINGGTAWPIRTQDNAQIPIGKLKAGAYYLGWYLDAAILTIGMTTDDLASERRTTGLELNRRAMMQATPLYIGANAYGRIFVSGGSGSPSLWIASGGDFGHCINVAGQRIIDLQMLPIGAGHDLFVYVVAGGGNQAKLQLGPGRKTLTAAGGTRCRISRPDTEVFIVTADIGSVTEEADVNDPAPARDYTIITSGQSLAVFFANGSAFHGFQLGMRDLGWIKTTWPIQGATGASGMIPLSGGDLYWWDPVLNAPGPCALAWKAALDAKPAGQPAVSAIYHVFGQTDATKIDQIGCSNYIHYYRSLFAWMRVQTGAQTPIIISTLGAQEAPFPTDAMFAAVRYVELALIGEDPNIHLGPTIYDLPRGHYESHPTTSGEMLQGYRMARALQNVLGGGTNRLGPTVVNLEELSGGSRFRLTFAQSTSGVPFERRYIENTMFAVLPAGADPLTGTPGQIINVVWELLNGTDWAVSLYLNTALPGGQVMFPYGGCSEVSIGRYIRDTVYTEASGNGFNNHLPLVPFVGTAGTPPVPSIIT